MHARASSSCARSSAGLRQVRAATCVAVGADAWMSSLGSVAATAVTRGGAGRRGRRAGRPTSACLGGVARSGVGPMPKQADRGPGDRARRRRAATPTGDAGDARSRRVGGRTPRRRSRDAAGPRPGSAHGGEQLVVARSPWSTCRRRSRAPGPSGLPPAPAISSSASSASATAGSSDAGSACAIEPPTVPRLRIWKWPMCGTARASSGTAAATRVALGDGLAGHRTDAERAVVDASIALRARRRGSGRRGARSGRGAAPASGRGSGRRRAPWPRRRARPGRVPRPGRWVVVRRVRVYGSLERGAGFDSRMIQPPSTLIVWPLIQSPAVEESSRSVPTRSSAGAVFFPGWWPRAAARRGVSAGQARRPARSRPGRGRWR